MASAPQFADEPAGENHLAIFLVTVAGAMAGIVPIVFSVGTPRWSVWLVAEAVAITLWRYVRAERPRRPPPTRTFLEYFLTALVAAFQFQIIGLFAVVPAALVLMVGQLINQVGSWFHMGWNLSAWNAAWWVGIVIAFVLMAVGAKLADERARAQLYAPRAHGRSAFYRLAIAGRRQLISVVLINVGIILGLAAAWLYLSGRLGPGFWLLVIFWITGTASQIHDLGDRPEGETKALKAATRLFEALGCKIERSPKVGDAEVDRLLNALDFVAWNAERCWGVQVKGVDESGEPIRWVAAAGFLSAVRAFREKRTQFAGIEPVMILVNTAPEESLLAFAEDQGMRIVPLSPETLDKISDKSPEELRKAALALFAEERERAVAGG